LKKKVLRPNKAIFPQKPPHYPARGGGAQSTSTDGMGLRGSKQKKIYRIVFFAGAKKKRERKKSRTPTYKNVYGFSLLHIK